jgi:hypothetical protein
VSKHGKRSAATVLILAVGAVLAAQPASASSVTIMCSSVAEALWGATDIGPIHSLILKPTMDSIVYILDTNTGKVTYGGFPPDTIYHLMSVPVTSLAPPPHAETYVFQNTLPPGHADAVEKITVTIDRNSGSYRRQEDVVNQNDQVKTTTVYIGTCGTGSPKF